MFVSYDIPSSVLLFIYSLELFVYKNLGEDDFSRI